MIMDVPVLAVTPGDPAGIGPEVLLRVSSAHPELRLLAIADPVLLREYANHMGILVRVEEWKPGVDVVPGALFCLPISCSSPARPGDPDRGHASYVLESLREAVNVVRAGHASALVTGPVNKAQINASGTPFSGHTEFLRDLTGTNRVVMMLATGGLRVALATTHLPLHEVPAAITEEGIRATIGIVVSELRLRFGIAQPRIQVLGLNPHAGEQGHLGSEEAEIIAPAIEAARDEFGEGVELAGPIPADTAFTPTRLARCDAVLAMYHDQGLPVLKYAGFGNAVNITLGLPFVRTSVDHGTAYDIATAFRADPSSMLAATRMAMELARK